jgi:cytochrome c2
MASRRAASVFLAAAVAALGAAAVPVVGEVRADWRGRQRQYAALTGRAASGVREIAPRGEPERCPTCHLGVEGGAEAVGRPRPFGPHSAILAQHPPERDGCVSCHGGAGRALDRARAHPTAGPDELRRGPLLAAGCPRCHTPGAVAGDEPVRAGLDAFVELGCLACHRAGGLDAVTEFGPDLSVIGRRGSRYLRRAVREPTKLFPGTKMPDFAPALTDRAREDGLVAFLLTLRGEPLPRGPGDALAAAPCASCHRGAKPAGKPHRCVFLRERRGDFACARCHSDAVPATGNECRYVARRRFLCAACHERGGGGG